MRLRRQLAQWGVIPIGPMPAQPPALVELGRALVFDKILSGNRDISCATCHQPSLALGDGLALAIGTGGTGSGASRTLGPGREFVPRNAPSLLNTGLGLFYVFMGVVMSATFAQAGGPAGDGPPEVVGWFLAFVGLVIFLMLLAPPLVWVSKVFMPVIWLLNAAANGVLRLFRVEPKNEAAFEGSPQTVMKVPRALVPAIR